MKNIKTETRVATIWIDENDIIHIVVKDAIDVDEFDVLDINLVVRNLSEYKPVLKLVDTRLNWSISAKAKKTAMQEDRLNKTIARAFIVSSNLKKVLFSFLKRFGSNTYPQNYFTNEADAYAWLMEFKK